MQLQESGEMYLETILIISKKEKHVRSLDVAEYMGYSKPSVCRAVGILKKSGFIAADADSYLTLTDASAKVANKIYDRHKLLTEFLVYLGVDERTAADDACKIEHDISDKSFETMKKHAESARKHG